MKVETPRDENGNLVCPRCGSLDVIGVFMVGDEDANPQFPHYTRTVDNDTPAFGCVDCMHRWGYWLDEYGDGRSG